MSKETENTATAQTEVSDSWAATANFDPETRNLACALEMWRQKTLLRKDEDAAVQAAVKALVERF